MTLTRVSNSPPRSTPPARTPSCRAASLHHLCHAYAAQQFGIPIDPSGSFNPNKKKPTDKPQSKL